jgi:hypothetical protein
MNEIKTGKLLTFVVSTKDRKELLLRTLRDLLPQILKHENVVDCVCVDSGSTDGTQDSLREIVAEYPFVQMQFFSESVQIDSSFDRCIRLAGTPWVCVFGDDDLPLPGFVETILTAIRTNPETSFIHVNRLMGGMDLKDLAVARKNASLCTTCLGFDDFIVKFGMSPGFITSLVFRLSDYVNSDLHLCDYPGYAFLARIYAAGINRQCVFIGYPLVVQRKSMTSWKSSWPEYWCITIPKMFRMLEERGVTPLPLHDYTRNQKLWNAVYISLLLKSSGAGAFDMRWRRCREFQRPAVAFVFSLIQWFVPLPLARFAINAKAHGM